MLNGLTPTMKRHNNRDGTGEFFGMRRGACSSAGFCTTFCLIALFVCTPIAASAVAQDVDAAVDANASPPADLTDEATPPDDNPLTPDEAAALGNALVFDPATLAIAKPAKPLRVPSSGDPNKFDISHTDKTDGSSTLTMKQPLSASEWDANVGADLNLAGAPSIASQPNKPLPLLTSSQDTGAAWASVEVPNYASIDARVDQASDQSKIGTTLKHSIPVGNTLSVTLQNTFSVTENFAASGAPAPSDIPLMAAPASGPPSPQTWGSEKAIKFNLLTTGTTLGAGITTASNDPVTHNTFSADQKVYGPLHVTTAVTDLGQPTANKSLSAAFKLNW
jgi:hypothetical protein